MANPKTKGFGRFQLDNLENRFLYNGQGLIQCEYVVTYFKIHTLHVYHVFAQKRRASHSMLHITSSFSCHSYKLLHSCLEGSPLIEKVLSPLEKE